MRKFYVIFKVNNDDKFRENFDTECALGNSIFRIACYGNKRSSNNSIINQAKSIVNWHKGLKITEIIDVIELS